MKNIIWRLHALKRMVQRNISREEVIFVLGKNEVVEYYEKDMPYPSRLVLGYTKRNRPLHIVYAIDEEDNYIIITVYEPNIILWDDKFIKRK